MIDQRPAPPSFVYVLRIRPGTGRVVWEAAFNRPPTSAEAICHIRDQVHQSGTVDAFALSCIDALKRFGVPEHYRAGSQGVTERRHPPPIELVLMYLRTLAFEVPQDLGLG